MPVIDRQAHQLFDADGNVTRDKPWIIRTYAGERMNTSMTINGTAMWLLALYVALARERGVDTKLLTGTTQNDLIKEYLARGTYIFPPAESLRITAEMYEFCLEESFRRAIGARS